MPHGRHQPDGPDRTRGPARGRDSRAGQTDPRLHERANGRGGQRRCNSTFTFRGSRSRTPTAAQYLITGSNNGNLQARATDPHNKSTLVPKAYSGAPLRRQVHAFADDFVQALGRKGIAQTQIAFKGENSPTSEIYVADFDGHNAQAVTKDNNLVAAPCWVPGHLALYYVSYKLNHADIFYHDLSTEPAGPSPGLAGPI